MIQHMVEESAQIVKGAKHEDNWSFYHNTLTLTTLNYTKERTRSQTVEGVYYFEKWLIPQNNLNIDIP